MPAKPTPPTHTALSHLPPPQEANNQKQMAKYGLPVMGERVQGSRLQPVTILQLGVQWWCWGTAAYHNTTPPPPGGRGVFGIRRHFGRQFFDGNEGLCQSISGITNPCTFDIMPWGLLKLLDEDA